MRAVVTGAGGFIGSHLCSRLREQGIPVRGLLLPEEAASQLERIGVEIFRGDLLRPRSLEGLLDDADTVFHLAARVVDWGRRKAFRDVIITGTGNLLRMCIPRRHRFVFLSSIAAYGVGRSMQGFTEEMPCRKTGVPYGDAKMEAESLVRKHAGRRGQAWTIIRPANVTGPGSVWVREVLAAFRRGPMPLVDQGAHSASLLGVENLVDGILLAATRPDAVGQTFNLRDDWRVTWRDYLEDMGALAGKRPRGSLPFPVAWSLGLLLERVCDPLGWRPPLTRMAAGITGRNNDVSVKKARDLLGWHTRVPYEEALDRIRERVHAEERQVVPVGPAG